MVRTILLLRVVAALTLAAPLLAGEIRCGEPEFANGDAARLVRGNYLEIRYDARSGRVEWTRHGLNSQINQNTSFSPFAYVKERILVKVCNANFRTSVSTATTITTVPESAPDIRGLDQGSTAPNPANSMGNVAALNTNPFASPLSAPIVRQIPAPSAGPADAFRKERLLASVNALVSQYEVDFVQLDHDIAAIHCASPATNCSLDTVTYIFDTARTLNGEIARRAGAADALTNVGAFERLAARTGTLVTALTNLSSALTAAAFSARLQKLSTDLEAINTVMNAARQGQNSPGLDQDPGALNSLQARIAMTTHNAADLAGRLKELDASLRVLHDTASETFHRMNDLHDKSRHTIAKVLDPVTGNSVINVSIVVHDVYAPFGFAPGTPAAANNSASTPPGPGGGNPGDKSPGANSPGQGNQNNQQSPSPGPQTATAAPEQHEVRRILVEVHRLVDFNIVAGFVAAKIPQRSFGLVPATQAAPPTTTTSGTPAPPAQATVDIPVQTQNDKYQLQFMLGVNIYLLPSTKRDMFPGYLTKKMRLIPGLLLATAPTGGMNFLGGLNWEPVNGFDFYGGVELANETRLGANVIPAVTYLSPTGTAPTRQSLGAGAFFGAGFDSHLLTALFKKVFSQ